MSVTRLVESLKVVDKNLDDPFWAYTAVGHELIHLETNAVWAIRDKLRVIEKRLNPRGKPKINFRSLHDLARHAIHVTETLDVATLTMSRIISQHEHVDNDCSAWQSIHDRLMYFQSLIESQRCRSDSNQKRLHNELQLEFNQVTQYDSRTAVEISQATRADSAAMKTIAALTLVFLPPTFICAIFSMSFFSFDRDLGWAVSGQFWVYWVCALPMTALTSVIYFYWQKNLYSKFVEEDIDVPSKPSIADFS